MLYKWKTTDGNGGAVRAVFMDCKKAFDFINHYIYILVRKLKACDLPDDIVNWIIYFLSFWKLGLWLFISMINDLYLRDTEILNIFGNTLMIQQSPRL